MTNDKKLPNLKVLKPIRLKGVHLAVGTVVAKADFASAGDDRTGDWLDLCAMEPPTLVQTAESTGAVTAPTKKRGKTATVPLPPSA